MGQTLSSSPASLAILPFENLSGKEEYDYFARGLVEELIVDLSNFSVLQVISSYTSSRLDELDVDAVEAARNIEVDYLFKGSLHLQKDAIRLNVQLLDTITGQVIWADRFDAPLDSLFDIQESIVERVVFTISSEVKQDLLTAARKKPLTNLEAYDCWLRGMDRLRFGTLEADHEAREFFHQALAIDPHFSRAYVGLSLSHFNEWSCQLKEIYEESARGAYTYAVKALELDEGDHIAQMILGRVYIYRRQFDQAEHHITRSLELNANDADNLVQLASCLTFLGRAAEGERLFSKALRLNPYRNLWYYQYGSLAYFVQKKYRVSIEMALKRQLVNVWLDLPGYIAAAYAHLGEKNKAKHYVSLFVDSFTAAITDGRKPDAEEIVEWVREANPFKHQEDVDNVVDGIMKAGIKEVVAGETGGEEQGPSPRQLKAEAICRQEQAIWYFVFDGKELILPDLKGLHDIARLLAVPDTNIHCTELMGSGSSMDENDYTLDDRARREYRQRMHDLQKALEEAEQNNDLGRREKLCRELDQLTDHLSANLGLGGKPRKMKSPTERARAAVTLRIRSVIKRITGEHPSLGKHLANSIRTGVFCCYSPEERRQWRFD